MSVITITGLCIIATIICKFFEKGHKEYSMLIALGVVIFVFLMVLSYINPVISAVNDLFSLTGISNDYLKIIFKAIGICYLTQLGCDYCKDANENAFSSEIELAGKVSLLVIALPLFTELIEIVKKLIYI